MLVIEINIIAIVIYLIYKNGQLASLLSDLLQKLICTRLCGRDHRSQLWHGQGAGLSICCEAVQGGDSSEENGVAHKDQRRVREQVC